MHTGEAFRLCQDDGTWGDPDVIECERTDFRDIEAMVSSNGSTIILFCIPRLPLYTEFDESQRL